MIRWMPASLLFCLITHVKFIAGEHDEFEALFVIYTSNVPLAEDIA